MELKRRYSPPTLLIEESPISLGLIQSLREQSINVTTYKPDTDKRARLIAQTDLFAGGSVRLPRRAGWLEEFNAELLAFPGRHDDQVDALTQGLAWGRDAGANKIGWGHIGAGGEVHWARYPSRSEKGSGPRTLRSASTMRRCWPERRRADRDRA